MSRDNQSLCASIPSPAFLDVPVGCYTAAKCDHGVQLRSTTRNSDKTVQNRGLLNADRLSPVGIARARPVLDIALG